MNTQPSLFYSDFSSFTSLKAEARADQEGAIEKVAKQFESLFVQMMVKSMRDASMGEDLMGGDNMKTYQEMYDKQISLHVSEGRGMGLAASIERQLRARESVNADGESKDLNVIAGTSVADYFSNPVMKAEKKSIFNMSDFINNAESKITDSSQFIAEMKPLAINAAKKIGVPVESLLSQAALETGWGKHVIDKANGQSSHNLFGIKADSRWDGETATVQTTEYKNGKAIKVNADFRAYGSYQDSFNDYASFIKEGQRYQQAIEHADKPAEYFDELQKAGYATDPNYSKKIQQIMDSMIQVKNTVENNNGIGAI